jgi:hypothetical protein
VSSEGQTTARHPRPPSRSARRRRWGLLARILAAVVLLAVGIALGDALGDRPGETKPATVERDLGQVVLTETVAERTITVTVTASP